MSNALENTEKKEKEINEMKAQKKIGNYILLKNIGKGTFSKVSLGYHILTNELVAIKILQKNKIQDKIDLERINREMIILKMLCHPNISQLYETLSTINNYYIIMEYIEGGDLFDHILKNKYLSEKESCLFFRQLISSIEYLNKLNITHRDIKPENILLDKEKKNIKLIDFGLSNFQKKNLLKSSCGSPCYASPEMISGKPYNGIKTDIWSSGIVLYCMLVGALPFDDEDIHLLYQQIKNGKFYLPSTLSNESIDLLKKILVVNPNLRIDIHGIKNHPWFNLNHCILYKGIFLNDFSNHVDIDSVKEIKKNFFHMDSVSEDDICKMIKTNSCNKYSSCYYLYRKSKKLGGDEFKESNFDNNNNNNINNSNSSYNKYKKKINLIISNSGSKKTNKNSSYSNSNKKSNYSNISNNSNETLKKNLHRKDNKSMNVFVINNIISTENNTKNISKSNINNNNLNLRKNDINKNNNLNNKGKSKIIKKKKNINIGTLTDTIRKFKTKISNKSYTPINKKIISTSFNSTYNNYYPLSHKYKGVKIKKVKLNVTDNLFKEKNNSNLLLETSNISRESFIKRDFSHPLYRNGKLKIKKDFINNKFSLVKHIFKNEVRKKINLNNSLKKNSNNIKVIHMNTVNEKIPLNLSGFANKNHLFNINNSKRKNSPLLKTNDLKSKITLSRNNKLKEKTKKEILKKLYLP